MFWVGVFFDKDYKVRLLLRHILRHVSQNNVIF